MTIAWERAFRHPMLSFETLRSPRSDEVAVSVKVRVVSGCFHREHSPHAYDIMDRKLLSIPVTDREFAFVEHESGPEVLVYLAVAAGGITLAKSVIDLITTIMKARSERVKKGERLSEPIELIIRRVEGDGEFREDTVLRIGHNDPVDPKEVEKLLRDAAANLLRSDKDISS